MKKIGLFMMILLLCNIAKVQAQELNTNDGDQILSQVDVLVEDYEQLLNTITNSGISLKETELIIANSFATENKKRLFWNSSAIIEDDINPEKAIADSAADLPVEKYLQDLDLLYSKSESPSIRFNNVSVSSPKRKNNFYVKVYYDCLFENKHKKSKTAYKTVRRVAEVSVDKTDGKWMPYILNVRFFQKQDSINDIQYDVRLLEVEDIGTGVNTALENVQQSYFEYINKGETALKEEDFETAEAAFEEALKIRPNSHHPLRKLREIRGMDWYTIYYTEATKAKQFRNYDAAIESYKKAREIKVTDSAVRAEIEKLLEELNSYVRNRDLFESSYSAGKYDDLIKEYNKRLKSDNISNFAEAELHLFLGKCYIAKNNPEDALKELKEAIQKDGNYEQALLERAFLHTSLYHSANKNDEKLQHIREAHADISVVISNNPKVAENYVYRASVREYLGDFDGATKDYEQAIVLEPKNANRHYTKGMYHLKQKDMDLGYSSLNRAIELEPAFAAAYYARGMVEYEHFKQLNKAADDFKSAIGSGLDENNRNNITSLSFKHYQEGVNFYQKADYENAISKFEEATTLKPDNIDAYFMKGESFYQQNKFSAAIKSYEDALNINSQLHVALYKKGEAYYHLSEFQQALTEYEKVVKEKSFEEVLKYSPEAAALIIDSYIGIGKSNQALEKYGDAVFINETTIKLVKKSGSKMSGNKPAATAYTYISQIPFNEKLKLSELYNNLGRCRYKMKSYKVATKNLDKALDYHKKNRKALYNRGAVYYALKDYKNAIKDFTANIENGSNKSNDYFVRAQSYQMANKHTEAITNYRYAINADSNLVDAYYLSGISFSKLNKLMEAMVYYNDYMKKSQEENISGNVYAERGIINLKLKQNTEAKADFDKALLLDAGNAKALYGLGCLYALENKLNEAISEFEKAFNTKKISRERIKEDTPVLLSTIAKEKRFKKLVKAINKNTTEDNSYIALYDQDETARLTFGASSK
ncbi:hypothetical protein GCM10023188_36370 [Pontibacter saemangeumensis]|uniref:Tetratricopeptide repeat-containing protein n=1 Tax=Pontibacter saemangeumensis TaxID=1084525 RepID=A0ABP8M0X9_9BACT